VLCRALSYSAGGGAAGGDYWQWVMS
jgi:hypothetical protein